MTARKILVVYTRLTQKDAVGRNLLEIAQLASDAGHAVSALSFEAETTIFKRTFILPGRCLPLVFRYFFLAYLTSPILLVLRHLRVIDVVITAEGCYLWPTIACFNMSTQTNLANFDSSEYYSLVNQTAQKLNLRLHALVEGSIARRAAVLVVPSDGVANEIRTEAAGAKTFVIPNFLAPVSQGHQCVQRSGSLRLGFVANGRVTHKGLPQLIEAQRLLAARGRPIELVLAGITESEVRTSLPSQASPSGRITYLANGPRPFERMGHIDAFVFPSRYEAFSMVLAEAAQRAIPIICTRTHGMANTLISRGAAIEIDRSAESVSKGIEAFIHLSSADRLLLGEAGRRASPAVDRVEFRNRWTDALLAGGVGSRCS